MTRLNDMKRYAVFLLKIAFGVALLTILFVKLDIYKVGNVLKNAHVGWLIGALLVYFTALFINAYKWRLLLGALGIASKTWDLFKANLISFFYGAVLPGGQVTGEAVKCYRITKGEGRKTDFVASVFMDRLTGLAASVWLGLVGVIFTSSYFSQRSSLIGLLTILSVASAGIFILTDARVAGWAERVAGKLVESIKIDLLRYAVRVVQLFFCFRGTAVAVWRSVGLGIVFQLLCAFCGMLIAMSIGVSVSYFDMLWVTSLVSILVVIPISIMGIGLREGGFVYLLGLLLVSPERAMGISLLNLLLVLIGAAWGGVLELLNHFATAKHSNAERLVGNDLEPHGWWRIGDNKKGKKYPLLVLLFIVWMLLHIPILVYGTQNVPLIKSYVGDEQSPIAGAMHIAQARNPLALRNHSSVYYGPIFSVVVLPAVVADYVGRLVTHQISGPDDYKLQYVLNWGPTLFNARAISLIFSFLTLLGFWKIMGCLSADEKHKKIKLFFLVLLATNLHFFLYSVYVRHWIYVLFVGMWQTYFALRLEKHNRIKDWLWFGLLTVFGFGISYLSLVYQILLLPLLWVKFKSKDKPWLKYFLVCVLSVTVGMVLMALWNPFAYFRVSNLYGTAVVQSQTSFQSSFLYYIGIIVFNQPFLSVAGVILLAMALKARAYCEYWFLASTLPALLYYAVFGVISHHEPRYALPLIMALIVVVAFVFLKHPWSPSSNRLKMVIVFLLGMEIVWQVANVTQWSKLASSGVEEGHIIPVVYEIAKTKKVVMDSELLLGAVPDKATLKDFIDHCLKAPSDMHKYLLDTPYPPGTETLGLIYKCSGTDNQGDVLVTSAGQELASNFFEERFIRLWFADELRLRYFMTAIQPP